MTPRLAIVTVNWNGGEEAVANLAATAALAARRGDTEVVVVDNASSDGSAEKIAKLPLTLLRSDRNLGFGPGSNFGVEAAHAPLVLLLNPDAAPAAGEDPLAPLLAAADGDPGRAGFVPTLLDGASGGQREAQERFQFRRLPTLGSLAREFLLWYRLVPTSARLRRERYLDLDRAQPFEVEQPAAAALLLRRAVFRDLGGFDPRFVPAWWEDVDLAMRLARAGHRLVTVPDSRFVHRGGSSIGDDRLSEQRYRRIYGRNLIRFADKWWGGRGRIAVRSLLFVGGALRLVLASVGARGGRDRRLTRLAARGTLASAFAPLAGEP